jgi:predicted N-acyltransferase
MILLKDSCSEKVDGFVQIPVLPEMSLAIHPEWESLNNYLKALSSKYRVRMNSALSKTKDLEIQSFTADKIETHISNFEALFMQVYERAEYKIIPAKINFLVKLKKHFPENFHVNVWKKDGKIIAFNSLLIDEQKAHAMMIGMDYSCNDTYKLYQNILINLIDSSIYHKVKSLNFGRTAMEIKSAVGAEPVDSFVNVRFRSKTHQLIFKKLIQSYKITEWVQRKPFKIQVDQMGRTVDSYQAVDSL